MSTKAPRKAARRLPRRATIVAAVLALAARRSLVPAYSFQGKVALVTGGSRGLGLALARELLAAGASVMLAARTQADLVRAQALLGGPGRVEVYAGDLTQAAHVSGVLEATTRAFGRLDVLVHSAGLIQTGPLADMTEGDFREVMEVNAFAPLRLTLAARPLLRGGGRVLLVASVGGKVAVPHLAPYSVSKFAAAGVGQALRGELAREGIRVTTALPALMRTGSARHAQIKGQHEKEYALFATLDNVPLLSLDAQTAARRMLAALARGQAEVMVTGPAHLLRAAQALAPELLADALALGARWLPAPTGQTQAVPGRAAESAVTRENPLKAQAEREFNQLGEPGESEPSP